MSFAGQAALEFVNEDAPENYRAKLKRCARSCKEVMGLLAREVGPDDDRSRLNKRRRP
jgi:hypothetical protein